MADHPFMAGLLVLGAVFLVLLALDALAERLRP